MSPDTTTIRAFIAVPIPEGVKTEIERVQDGLRQALPKHCARWTKREKFHLTLRFLGNVEKAHLPELTAAVGTACQGFAPLKLRAERVGCFPDLRFPRVVWIGIHDETGRLGALQQAVAQASVNLGESQAEKEFSGHVTIARTKEVKRPQAEILAKLVHSMTARVFGEWRADQVEIMHSELLSHGAQHSVIASFSLNG